MGSPQEGQLVQDVPPIALLEAILPEPHTIVYSIFSRISQS